MPRRALEVGVAFSFLLWGLWVAAQGPPEEGVPVMEFTVDVEPDGTFIVFPDELPDVAIEGRVVDQETGEPLGGLSLLLQLEGKPGKNVIRGPWDIGAVLLMDPTGEFAPRIRTQLGVSVDFRAGRFVSLVSAGDIAVARSQPCTTGEDWLLITGEDRRVVQFHHWRCEDGAWAYKGVFRARKVPWLPESLPPGQWFVIISEGREGLTYSFHRAGEDGATTTLAKTISVGDALPPGTCEVCEYFVVEKGEKKLIYHCVAPGKWELVFVAEYLFGRPRLPPEEPPPEEPPEEEEPPPAM